jgi:hypothetical protein
MKMILRLLKAKGNMKSLNKMAQDEKSRQKLLQNMKVS